VRAHACVWQPQKQTAPPRPCLHPNHRRAPARTIPSHTFSHTCSHTCGHTRGHTRSHTRGHTRGICGRGAGRGGISRVSSSSSRDGAGGMKGTLRMRCISFGVDCVPSSASLLLFGSPSDRPWRHGQERAPTEATDIVLPRVSVDPLHPDAVGAARQGDDDARLLHV
jgi:hypothetical protein